MSNKSREALLLLMIGGLQVAVLCLVVLGRGWEIVAAVLLDIFVLSLQRRKLVDLPRRSLRRR